MLLSDVPTFDEAGVKGLASVVSESHAFELGGGYRAPGQLVGDFIRGQRSGQLGNVLPSYQPEVQLPDLAQPGRGSLPDYAPQAIREALPAFERQIKGFSVPDAVLTGEQTRTSSPLRIARGRDFQSLNVAGLYPAGEGAGDAGGIMSGGVNGIEVAESLAAKMMSAACATLWRPCRNLEQTAPSVMLRRANEIRGRTYA